MKERRRNKAIRYEKASTESEQGEKETKPITCTITSPPENKVLVT